MQWRQLVPFRHGDRGWFDYNPMLTSVPMALWHHGNNPADRQRLEELREQAGYDWRTVRSFRITLTLALHTRTPAYVTPFD